MFNNSNIEYFFDKKTFPLLFEIVPPEKGNEEKRLNQHTDLLEQLFANIEPDALNIPEIQNESQKGEKGKRSTSYKERVPPRRYARLLSERFDTEFIINRVIVKHSGKGQEDWLLETSDEFGLQNIIFVGGESSMIQYPGLSVPDGNRLAKQYLNRGRRRHDDSDVEPTNFTVGNICIPTRRRDDYDEPERMLHKIKAGSDFFTSQIITEAENPISLLNDLSEILEEEDRDLPLIFWSFTPISSQKDVDFLRWLGVHIPENTEKMILGSKDPVSASCDLAQNVLEKVVDFNHQLPVSFPMGINISVMGLRNFENGIRLAKELEMVGIPD